MSKDSILRAIVRGEPEMEVRAAVTVADHALDAADAAELLSMLGLLKPVNRLGQDPTCPASAAHQRLADRRSTAVSGPVSGEAGPRG